MDKKLYLRLFAFGVSVLIGALFATQAFAQNAARLEASRIASEQSVKEYYLQNACEKIAGFAAAVHVDKLAGQTYVEQSTGFDRNIAMLTAQGKQYPDWFIQAAPKVMQFVYNMRQTPDTWKVKATFRTVCLQQPDMFYINPNALN